MDDWKPEQVDWHRINPLIRRVGSGKKVLDIGARNGFIAKLIEKNNNSVVCADIDEDALKKAEQKGFECVKMDAEKTPYPFKDESFDAVVALEIIEHLRYSHNLVKESHRILKKGGMLLLSTPNLASLTNRLRLLLGKNPAIDWNYKHPGHHVKYFIKKTITQALEQQGFEIEKITGDVVTCKGKQSPRLGKMFPTLARTLLVIARKK
ncbi:class I SAM-dependent methyltransferase [Candidatus Micrarchaeota archaeon]|nr:class I SAM-dependent methyltransferase [Candidatus Micrarchaeota archaeon]